MSLLKLEIATSTADRIDAEKGKLSGVSVISTPEAKGHNISIDSRSIESFAEAVKDKKIKAYYTHSEQNEALDSIGLWENFQIVEDGEYMKLTADFQALEAWKEHHRDDYDALFEMADKAPEAFGVSAEFTIDKVYYNENGEEEKYEGQADKEVFARAIEVSAFSIVAQPAANPTGLFAEAKEDSFVQLSETIIDLEEQKSGLALELETMKSMVEKISEQNSDNDEKIKMLESEVKLWKAKYSTLIENSGAEPQEANGVEEPKTFEEKLEACTSWKEKNELIQGNMQYLTTNWNQLTKS